MFFLAPKMIEGAFSQNAILISLLTDSSAPNFSFLVDLDLITDNLHCIVFAISIWLWLHFIFIIKAIS